MAAIATGFPKRVPADTEGDGYIIEAKWTLTTADPNGDAIALPEWADVTLSVLATGTTMGSATVALQTSPVNVSADFATCKSAAGGAAMAITTAPGCATAIERSKWIRPSLTTPGTGATVVVHVIARRSNPLRT